MIVYVNGDSHTYGIGVATHERFSDIVAQEFKQDTINDAKVGASNQSILRTTRQYLETHRPSLVLIGWSTWEREEWHYQDQYYNVNSSGHTGLPGELQKNIKNG